MSVDALKEDLRRLDAALIEAAAERVKVARELAAARRAEGRTEVDYEHERRMLDRAEEIAERCGLDEHVAKDLLETVLHVSLGAQEEVHRKGEARGSGRSALVVGGAGRMGRWFVRFLEGQGFTVHIRDPASQQPETSTPDEDLIIVATPPTVTADLYEAWSHAPPAGVVCDISSIKSPLIEPLRWLQKAGGNVASLHPMFGPDTRALRDHDVLLCDTGDAKAMAQVRALFAGTAARLRSLPIKEHDRCVADVLALAHVVTIAFARALPDEPATVSSTTLSALEAIALEVVQESPQVYYEVQADNPHAEAAVKRLMAALEKIRNVVEVRDRDGFAALMADGRERLGAHRAAREVSV